MDGFSLNERKNERIKKNYMEGEIISQKAYNLIMGLVVIYGLAMNAIFCRLFPDVLDNISPVLFLIIYLVCCLAGIFISRKSTNPVVSFIGYNFVVLPIGLLVADAVKVYGGMDSSVVERAFVFTAGVTIIMTTAGLLFPDFFRSLGRVLLVALASLLVCELISLLLGRHSVIFDFVAAGIFSMYIGYDFYRSQMFTPTADNAVDCALDIYLDIINLFLRILSILGNNKD